MPNVEDLLKKAMQEGKFDNLPGKGKPIKMDKSNPHADPEWELAYGMLKEAGYSLPWIETIKEIEKEIELARKRLRQSWGWAKADIAQLTPGSNASPTWERAKQIFHDQVVELNKRIRDYNLHVPSPRFQRPALNFEQEVINITKSDK